MLVQNFIELFLESAPWLLLGLILAGLLKVFVPMAWMNKQLGGHGFKTTVKAAVMGAPLPLCSCGVIPAAVGLRRAGASKAATTSFLVSTPETGVDSVTVSYVLLGPFMAVVRPIAAVVSAIVAGLLVGRDDDDGKPAEAKVEAQKSSCCSSKQTTTMSFKPVAQDAPLMTNPQSPAASCCSSTKVESRSSCCSSSKPVVKSSCCSSEQASHGHHHDSGDSCCDSTKDVATELQHKSVLYRIGWGLRYAATDLVKDTTVWLLIGLFFAALVTTYVPSDFLVKWGDGILAMLVMVLVSVPMYICATASTPIAAGLLLAGVSPGAVLVFMLAGPATNIATLGVVSKELGKRALWAYLGGVLGVALVSGVLVNYLVAEFGFKVMPQIGEHHELLPHWLVVSSGIILAILMAKVLAGMLPRNWWRRDCCS
ncbi:SO_0444 family Cu/Zn efflux transporter [Shewanella marina]|uniref:SO_0444 family Cu/Zn efflux transporter n=1 Tax=Shewanella marina TaxID=487319 RepID=UPI00046E8B3B|nr:SO_0444 family Cu/Zn efflux transporter [Shewanella marina]